MPRKSRRTQKPPLLFLERSLDGARLLQTEPEVRAAVRPKSFIAAHGPTPQEGSTSWVSPQFEACHLTALPARRGRRRGNAATSSVLDRSSQLSRKPCLKTSVACTFPALSFERGPTQPGDLHHGQPKQMRGRRSSRVSLAAPVSTGRQQQQQQPQPPQQQPQHQLPFPSVRRGTSLPSQLTPKRQLSGTPHNDSSTSSDIGSELNRPSLPSRRSPPLGPLVHVDVSPTCGARVVVDGVDPNANSCHVSSPPNVDTPEQLPPGRGPSPHMDPPLRSPSQLSQPQPETLVADTPEQDYGLRVTWRRRKGLMMALENGGQLSKLDTIVPP